MKISKYFIMFIFLGLAVSDRVEALDAISLDQIPSETLRKVITIKKEKRSPSVDLLSELDTDVEKRQVLFINAWGYAVESSPMDNRPYLFALAIDLYNTIPPDLMPELRELGPDEDIYEPDNAPIKAQLASQMYQYIGFTSDARMGNWIASKGTPFADTQYLIHYMLENKLLEIPTAPASLAPEQLDILNPTYYAELQEFVKIMRPAIEADLAPWDAVEKYPYTPPKRKPVKQADVAGATTPAVVDMPEDTAQPEPASSDTAGFQREWLWGLIALLLLGAVWLIRRKKP